MNHNTEALAADYFERHKSSKECHITSDGRVFHNRGAADSFAGSLENKEVSSHTRPAEAIEVVEATDVTGDNSAGGAGTGDVKITLADFNVETTSYNQALALAKNLGVTLASQKKEDVFAALTALQAKVNE